MLGMLCGCCRSLSSALGVLVELCAQLALDDYDTVAQASRSVA